MIRPPTLSNRTYTLCPCTTRFLSTATRDAAVARVNVAKASLAETQARNGRLDIRAPAAGLVLTRDVEPGQIVSAGSGVLFRVALGGQMEMQAKLAESADRKSTRLNSSH